MKIISWNLNHRTNEKAIPIDALKFFEKYAPHLIVLNEYVDGDSRNDFKRQLNEIGYSHQLCSLKRDKQNQSFVASRQGIQVGNLPKPDFTEAATTNFLHVSVPDSNIEIVGFRAPAYKKTLEKRGYWKQLSDIVSSTNNGNIVFLGDINYDPFFDLTEEVSEINFSHSPKFTIPNPKGEWSYISSNGKNISRIDHAIISKNINATNVEYLASYCGIKLAGCKFDLPISDHAVLSLNVDVAKIPTL